MSLVDILLTLAAVPVAAASAYLALLTLASRRAAPPVSRVPRLKFDLIVPAHNEEGGIATTVASMLALDYPRWLFRVLVVADNCSDATATAAANAGGEVLVRNVPEVRGKGHALALAFDARLADGFADVMVVVDADSVVSVNLLRALSARFEDGVNVAQVDYAVKNPEASWRTRLMRLAFAAIHTVRSLGRQRLGLSCGLRGNGMAFSARTLRAVPYNAFSVVEDVEYGITLGRAGVRIHYVPDAYVCGDMCQNEKNSRSQRRRWEQGRAQLARLHAKSLLAEAVRHGDRVRLDLGADLILPPLAQVAAAVLAGSAACGVAVTIGARLAVAPWLWGSAAAGIALYVGRAWVLSGAGVRSLTDLIWVPVFVAWKLTLRFKPDPASTQEWVRTAREHSVGAAE